MNVRLAFTRIALVLVVLGMAGLAGLGYALQRSDLKTLQDLSKENIMWSSAQLEIELHRFLGSLGRFAAKDPGVTADDIIDRFDILWSRTSLFEAGEVADRLNRYDAETKTVHALFQTLRDQEDLVLGLEDRDMVAITALLAAFQPHAQYLRQLSIRVIGGEEMRGAASRDSIREGQFMAAALSAGALIMAALLITVVYFEARKYRRLADHNAQLAREADAANQAKSRFLTMMSHELRTPMNGVLGQLALAKATGLHDQQLQLVEQAERSGRQMIGMLTDILDFSALQENQLAIDRSAFELEVFTNDLRDLFFGATATGRIPPIVTFDPKSPAEVNGDAQRLRQSVTHLVSYIMDTAGTRDLAIEVSHRDGEVVVEISFGYVDDNAASWRPELLIGDVKRDEDQFATEALGPIVARGLIETMGGRLALTNVSSKQTTIVVSVPAQPVERLRLKVLLDAASTTMRLLCEAALRGSEMELAPDDASAEDVDVALVEVRPDEEFAKLEAMRLKYPKARIIAIGQPAQPDIFDGVTPFPLKPERLRMALGAKAA